MSPIAQHRLHMPGQRNARHAAATVVNLLQCLSDRQLATRKANAIERTAFQKEFDDAVIQLYRKQHNAVVEMWNKS